jgi:hypothetical protein
MGAVICNEEKLEIDVVRKTAERTVYLKDGSFVTVVLRTGVPELGTVAYFITRAPPCHSFSNFRELLELERIQTTEQVLKSQAH